MASVRWALVGEAARVQLGPGVGLDLGVGPQERAGDLVGVDPDRQVERVVDDVLGQVEGQVEHVVAARPAGADAVGRLGRAVPADDVLLGQGEDVLAEGQGGLAADPIPRERDASVQETHVRSSSSSPGRGPTITISPESRPGHRLHRRPEPGSAAADGPRSGLDSCQSMA